MEVIKKVEEREDFKEWQGKKALFVGVNEFGDSVWDYMPDTAKLALIQEWLRDEKGLHVNTDQGCEVWEAGDEIQWIDKYHWIIARVEDDNTFSDREDSPTTYNQALAKGIEEALKIIEPNN